MARKGPMARRASAAVPGLIAAGAGWAHWHEPARLAGLGVAEGAALLAWPLILIAVMFGLPVIGQAAVPVGWRIWWRHGAPVGRIWLRRTDARPAIPVRLRRAVLCADRRRCVYCHRHAGLQIDHVRPWAAGGLSSLWNLAVLCEHCNRVKSNYWVWRSGAVTYRPWSDADDIDLAAEILRAERLARINPLRWWRAAWLLA